MAGPAGTARSPARRLRDATEPLAVHAVGAPAVRAALAAHGLARRPGWAWGRAASLGEPAPEVVAAVFAVFEPAWLRAAYEAGRAACPRDVLLRVREQAVVRSLSAVLGPGSGAAADVAAVLRDALAGLPVAGRPLYAGLTGLPWPADPWGALWRACELVREHRGDAHVAVWTTAGLDAVGANLLTELRVAGTAGPYTLTRGWSRADVAAGLGRLQERGLVAGAALTPAGAALRAEVEAATDRAEQPLVDALGPRLEAVVARLAAWSDRCVAAGTCSPDPAKRAAG